MSPDMSECQHLLSLGSAVDLPIAVCKWEGGLRCAASHGVGNELLSRRSLAGAAYIYAHMGKQLAFRAHTCPHKPLGAWWITFYHVHIKKFRTWHTFHIPINSTEGFCYMIWESMWILTLADSFTNRELGVVSHFCYHFVIVFVSASSQVSSVKTPWSESASELYRPIDRRLSAKRLPTCADIGCHVVSVTDPSGRILSVF
jgi:hypothetical protein